MKKALWQLNVAELDEEIASTEILLSFLQQHREARLVEEQFGGDAA